MRTTFRVMCFGALGTLFIAWIYFRNVSLEPQPAQNVSLLDVAFNEPEFAPSATATQLLDLADRQIRQLLNEFPDASQPYNVKANRDFLISDTTAAREAWKRAAELNPQSPDALFGLANLAFEAGQYQETIGLCDELMRYSPGNPRVPLLQADAYIHNAQSEKAILTLEQHIATEHTSVQALEMLGNAYLHAKNLQQAVACFERALEFAPDSKDSHYGLGQAFARLGDREKASSHLSRFEVLGKATGEVDSDQAKAFKDRDHAAHVAAQVLVDSALIYKQVGDLVSAEDKLLRAQKLQPDVIQWLEELYRVLAAQTRKQEAVDVLLRLIELAPSDVQHWLNLGQLYAELDRHAQAIAAFSKAIDLAPDDWRCQQARSVIRRLQAT